MIKYLQLIILFITFSNVTVAQNRNEDVEVIKETFKLLNRRDTFVYVRNLKGFDKKDRIIKTLSLGKFYVETGQVEDAITGQIKGGVKIDSLILSSDEIDFIITNIQKPTSWDMNMFPNSISVNNFDEAFLKLDRVNNKLSERSYFYYFIKPIFIRDQSVCFISYGASCGASCGENESAFFRKVGATWEMWIIISSGVY